MNADDFVFKAGSLGDKFYIILKGSVRILIPIKDKTVKDKKNSLFDKTEVSSKQPSRYNFKIAIIRSRSTKIIISSFK